MGLVVSEVVTVGIVGLCRDGSLVGDDPAAIGPVHEQTVQLRHDRFLLCQQGVQACAIEMIETIAFKALRQHSGNRVHLANGIFGVLRRSPGQVADHVFGIGESLPVVAPDPPPFDRHEGQQHNRHERQHQAKQRHGAPFTGYGE
ncbi:hypothetical protein D3C78_326940 [compost metagenome]